jgi:hypothetical protein
LQLAYCVAQYGAGSSSCAAAAENLPPFTDLQLSSFPLVISKISEKKFFFSSVRDVGFFGCPAVDRDLRLNAVSVVV